MTHNSNLPDNGIIRLKQVLELFPVSKTTWYDGVKSGKYPKPIHLGERARGWHVKDIKALIENGVKDEA